MARNLDKLSKDELYLFLAEKVDQEAATAIKNEGISGGTLIDLTDTELRDILPKLGHRRMVKRLVDDFQSSGPSEPKVKPSHQASCFDLHCIYKPPQLPLHTVQVAMCTHLYKIIYYIICQMWEMSCLRQLQIFKKTTVMFRQQNRNLRFWL